MKRKRPLWREAPSEEKAVRLKEDPLKADSQTIAWHIHSLDKDGEWGWHNKIDKKEMLEYILGKISNYETMTWSEIKRKNENHTIPVFKICKEAQKRLQTIRQDDADGLFSLRLSGKERIWGIRDRRVLRILWWDPKHTVCPYHKKHT